MDVSPSRELWSNLRLLCGMESLFAALRMTRGVVPLATEQPIEALNPLLRGWGEYYKRAHVRKLFNQLDRWIVQRIWSHRFKRWRNCGWKQLPTATLFGEYGLVNLVGLIPSLASSTR